MSSGEEAECQRIFYGQDSKIDYFLFVESGFRVKDENHGKPA